MLDEALGHLVRGIVDNPDDVSVSERSGRRGTTLEVSVNPADMGRVIGRSGRTATALRTVITSINSGRGVRVDFLLALTFALELWEWKTWEIVQYLVKPATEGS